MQIIKSYHHFYCEGEQTRDPNRVPQRPEVSHQARMGHEVMPGVYSTVARGRIFILQNKGKLLVLILECSRWGIILPLRGYV